MIKIAVVNFHVIICRKTWVMSLLMSTMTFGSRTFAREDDGFEFYNSCSCERF
jgi:hypothetical protein